MEDILSSIKRIIAEEGDAPAAGRAPRRPPPRAAATAPALHDLPDGSEDEGDAILELRESIEAAQRNAAARAQPEPESEPTPRASETIVSQRAAEASRGQLEALSRLIVRPDTPGADTLEGLVREMLRPMLSSWLDANLPRVVETMVAREIARISNREG
ncbi:pole-organizing protein PopZ [Sphingomonas japonica]